VHVCAHTTVLGDGQVEVNWGVLLELPLELLHVLLHNVPNLQGWGRVVWTRICASRRHVAQERHQR
jgi:hypothetical protein